MRDVPAQAWLDAAGADTQRGAPLIEVTRRVEGTRSSPRGRRRRLPGGHETAVPPPRPPPAGRCGPAGRRTALAEDRLRRSVRARTALLSCTPDRAESRCPAA